MSLNLLIKNAIAKRAGLIAANECFRLFDGAGDGLPGLYLDRYGSSLLAHVLMDSGSEVGWIREQLLQQEEILFATYGVTSLYVRQHLRQSAQTASRSAELLFGPDNSDLIVKENGVSYIVKLSAQVNAGLFLDMREVRQRLQETCGNKRILNTFCFSGSLGVAACAGGAREVTQVDVSASALRWCRENLECNPNLKGRSMRLIKEDVLTYLAREKNRQMKGAESYDLIIIDPPSFSRSGKTSGFQFKRDLPNLVQAALSILSKGGQLILSCNLRDLSPQSLQQVVEQQASLSGSTLKKVEQLLPPRIDFPSCGGDSIAMRGVWVQF